jgi:hypothetical protein
VTREVGITKMVAIGDMPLDFYCDWDGELTVHALPYTNVHYPSARIILGVHLPGGKPVARDADGAPVPSHAALTLDQVDELLRRLDVARVMVLNAAPRDTVEQHEGLGLVKSSLGRWGLAELDRDGQPVTWHETEESARALFLQETDRGKCEGCGKVVPVESLRDAGEDGPPHCPPCWEAAEADWRAMRVVHVDPTSCTWTGTIADLQAANPNHDMTCPTCGVDVDVEDDAPPLELPTIAEPPAAGRDAFDQEPPRG